MTVRLSLGPSGSGKTHRSLRRIREVRSEKPLAPIWVVAPGRLAVAAYRQRLGAAGGALGVRVGTFGDLFEEILGRAGRSAPSAPEPVQRLILRQAIQSLNSESALPHYRPLVGMPGFLEAMADTIAELDQAGVSPDRLDHVGQDGAPWLGELAAMQQAYGEALGRSGWVDAESLNQRACAALDEAPHLLDDIGLIVVDGFDSFEGDQLRALSALAQAVPDLHLTLPGTVGMSRPAHRRFARSLKRLVETGLAFEMEPVEPPVHQSGVLAELEAALFAPEADPLPPSSRLALIEARSPAEEAREALRWLKARIVRDKLPAAACALVMPDPARYRPLLRRAADEFEVPLRFTHGEPLSTAPGIVAVLDLLSLPLVDWPQRLTLEAVHTPYLDLSRFGIAPSDRHLLEAASRYGQVVSGLDAWLDALDRLARTEAPTEDPDAYEAAPEDAPRGEQAARLMRGLKGLADRLQPPLSLTSAAWVAWLEDLLDELDFPERQSTRRDQAALSALRDSLRALVLGGELAPQGRVAFPDFVRDLTALLEAAEFDERPDWDRPPVTVMRLLEARGVRFQAVAVLGLSEGVLPQVEREDPFLPDDVRRELGLEPRLGREQPGLFYQAVTRANDWLLLTRPYLAEDGEAWLPSPYWQAVSERAPHAVLRLSADAPRALADAASSQEVLFWGVRRGGLPRRYLESLGDRWVALQHARDVLAAQAAQPPTGSFEEDLSDLTSEFGRIYDDDHVWSPSRLETYASCPHRFFVERVLGLERREPPEPGFDAAQLGSMLHAILERAYGEADNPIDPASVKSAMARAAGDVFREAPLRLGFRPTALWDIECDEMLTMLEATVDALAETGSEWRPLGLEAAFGMQGKPPLVLETPLGSVRVRGFIDRVDRNPDGELRVIDYKTGSGHLAASDLREGTRLQLPLYALGAAEALNLGVPVDGFYWKIRQAEPGSLKLGSFDVEIEGQTMTGPSAAYAVAREHVARILTGVRGGAFPPVPPRGGCPEYCPAAVWCWRYEPPAWGG